MFFLFMHKLCLRWADFLCNFTAWVLIQMTCIETTLDWKWPVSSCAWRVRTPLHPHQFDESVPFPSVSQLIDGTSYFVWPVSLSTWSMNTVAGCPLDHLPCFCPQSSSWETISVLLLRQWPRNSQQLAYLETCWIWSQVLLDPVPLCQIIIMWSFH